MDKYQIMQTDNQWVTIWDGHKNVAAVGIGWAGSKERAWEIARQIAREHNAHAKLVEALQHVVDVIDSGDWYGDSTEYKTLIAEAEGGWNG